MRRTTILAALGTAAAVSLGATAGPANAAVTSGSITGTTGTLNLNGDDDKVAVSVQGGVLVHGLTGGNLNSTSDWNSAVDGDQTVPAAANWDIVINSGDGNDQITVVAKNDEIGKVTLNGELGDDVLTGADSPDDLNGGEGNDRLIGGKGADTMTGANGNDTGVWNNGDGNDTINGDGGNDATEVNGDPVLGDVFTMDPDAGRVIFKRTNLGTFTLNTSTDRFVVNGLAGNDSLTSADGVGPLTLLSFDGGAGNDTANGSDGADLLLGGEGNDILNGRGGDDRIVGDRGGDTMNGGAGDDTAVWNNGDGSDVINGEDGRDDVEVNGAVAAGDAFTVQPNGARIKFDRTNIVPFSLDIGSSESMHANGLGGDDTIAVGEVGGFAVTAAGGSGNDTLTGAGAWETLLGGTGNDTITPGGGVDIASGDQGDDQVNVRDTTADFASGGEGNDSVVADTAALDFLDGFEAVDRTAVIAAPPVVTPDNTTRPVTITGGTLKVAKRIAQVKVTCPANATGNCTGSLVLRTAKTINLGRGVKVVVQLGSARYNVAPGTTKTIKVKLAKGIERLADRKGRIKVLAVASTGASGKIASSSKSATLALGKKR